MSKTKIFLLGLVVFWGIGLVVFAQEEIVLPEITEAVNLDEDTQPEDLEVSKPRILPGHFLYFLKNWTRGIRMFFAFKAERKAELRLKFANEKIIEAKKLIELKRNSKIIKKALESFQKELSEIEKAKIENLKKFSDKLIHQQLLHQRILERLEKKVPPEVFERIKENREKHLERFVRIMTRVEEKFPEKLEEILEKQKGSKFKEFKNLERLTEIEEKVPEEMKEKIREKKEKILEKLHKKYILLLGWFSDRFIIKKQAILKKKQ